MPAQRIPLIPASFLIVIIVLIPGLSPAAEGAGWLGEGSAKLSFRYRYEAVEQQGLPEDAHASTLRSRLTYATPKDRQVALVLEADNVLRIGGANYSDGNRTVPGHPVVADPVGTEINQAHIIVAPHEKAKVTVGRQRMVLDNARFIGNVGWRQNEQTYDAGRLVIDLPKGMTFDLAHVWNVNRIFGPEGGDQASDWDCVCNLLSLRATPWEGGSISVFAYHQDLVDAPALANRTVGARLAGTFRTESDLDFEYLIAYARQADTGDNPVDYSAPYYHLEFAGQMGAIRAAVGLEVLGGDAAASGARFVTPLATLHAFNGWADKFLTTPDAGLEDLYLSASGRHAGFKGVLTWHRFSAEAGGADFGSEWDMSLAKQIADGLDVLIKAAVFESDGFATDTDKFWLMLSYTP